MNEANKIPINRIITTGKPSLQVGVKNNNNSLGVQGNFNDILRQKIEGSEELKFSKHAEMRLKERNIEISPTQMKQLKEAVNKAEQKGVRESLVLMDNLALVVSIKNKTVITAVNNEELKDNVFTNIDGAVIV